MDVNELAKSIPLEGDPLFVPARLAVNNREKCSSFVLATTRPGTKPDGTFLKLDQHHPESVFERHTCPSELITPLPYLAQTNC